MKRKYLTIFLISIVGIWLVWFLLKPAEPQNQATVKIGNTIYKVDIADTEVEREQGLSGRPSLARDSGMLFVFPEKRPYAFWMKDMQFPIDIVWADVDGKVITIASNVAPDTYPKSFFPSAPARYVVELPAGFAAANGIVEGGQIVL